MNKNKGFTLVELLSVIVLISLVLVIAVPSVQSIAYKTKVKLCNSKIEIIKNTVNLWSQNNPNCFLEGNNGCDILSTCEQMDASTSRCTVTLDELAENGILNYDETKEYSIINPVDKSNMNNIELTITYDRKNKLATSEILKTKLASGTETTGTDEEIVKLICNLPDDELNED